VEEDYSQVRQKKKLNGDEQSLVKWSTVEKQVL
jgi:hypothetical protein